MNWGALKYTLKHFRWHSLINLFVVIFFIKGFVFLVKLYSNQLGTTIFFLVILIHLMVPEMKKIGRSFINLFYNYYDYIDIKEGEKKDGKR